METQLFNQIIFGPIRSRRLGLSLGINLSPSHSKWCNFDCVYCECGWNKDHPFEGSLPSKADVLAALEHALKERAAAKMPLDSITFSGNGEPTMHPEFAAIVDGTIHLRNLYTPETKVSVLSNATLLRHPEVCSALRKVDNPILKIDSAIPATWNRINRPKSPIDLDYLVEELKKFRGRIIIQTMFVRGEVDGEVIDNTTEEELVAWLGVLRKIAPQSLMVYSLDRPTPAGGLQKVEKEELKKIGSRASKLGIDVYVA